MTPDVNEMSSVPGMGSDRVLEVREPSSGLEAYIVIDDASCGTAFGGIRRRRYPSREDALGDASRLARQMTLKTRFAGLPCGGAKAVIVDSDRMDRRAAYRALGVAIEGLSGAYFCGPDVGTTEADLDAVRSETSWVNDRGNRPGESTAAGVFAGLGAAVRHALHCDSPAGVVVLVEGLGSVGRPLALRLSASGARLRLVDIDRARVTELEAECPSSATFAPARVWAPCAVGPIIDENNVETVEAAVVCGSANDQLASEELAERLHDRGVLWVPDFAVNAGAVIEGVTVKLSGRDGVEEALRAIGPRIASLLEEARREDVSPLSVAVRRMT